MFGFEYYFYLPVHLVRYVTVFLTKIFSSTVNISFAKVAIATEILLPMASVATFSSNTAMNGVRTAKLDHSAHLL